MNALISLHLEAGDNKAALAYVRKAVEALPENPQLRTLIEHCACSPPRLAQVKRQGLLDYGALANGYVDEFDQKWLRGGAPLDEPLVGWGCGDIQSLNDMAGSFKIVQTMRPFPFSKTVVLQTAIAGLMPLLPLALTMISLEDLVKRLLGIFL